MSTLNMLYKEHFKINDIISVVIPRVGDVLEAEDDYFNLVTMFTSMPIDMMVQLDDIGVDFTTINEWELFLILFKSIQEKRTDLVISGIDFKNVVPVVTDRMEMVLRDTKTGAVIDRAVHTEIAGVLRKINGFTKDRRKPANDEAKKFMIERARAKQKRNARRKNFSQLETLIISIVNSEQFKYGFYETRDLTIYQFNESVKQIIKKTDYNNIMFGVYSGTVKAKDLSQDKLNWLSHK